MIAALLLAAAAPAGTLTLDMDRPVIEAVVNGRPLTLRVDLDQRDVAELNPATAARLGIAWTGGFEAQVGPIELKGREASVIARIAGRDVPLILSTHGRDCCAGTDGAVSPALLPYAEIRFVRRPGGVRRTWPLETGEGEGLTVQDGPVAVQLSLAQPLTTASQSAGALLAARYAGRVTGPYRPVAAAFGVARPMRPLAFDRPPALLGLIVPSLLVRGDYAGRDRLPAEPARPGDVTVSGRRVPQHRWPVVTLGRDRLGACGEIVFRATPPSVELACDVD